MEHCSLLFFAFAFLYLFRCKFPCQQWENWFLPSASHLVNCSFVVSIDSGFRNVNPKLWETSLSIIVLCIVPFAFSFILTIHFQSRSAMVFPYLFNEIVSYSLLNCFVTYCITSWDSLGLLNDFALGFIIYAAKLSGFDKCTTSCIHNYSARQNALTALKVSPMFHLFSPQILPNPW
jgi:hypothetical protein